MQSDFGDPEMEPTPLEAEIQQQDVSIERMRASLDETVHQSLQSALVDDLEGLRAWIGYAIDAAGRLILLLEYEDARAVDLLSQRFGQDMEFRRVGPIVLAAGPGDSIGASVAWGASGTFGCIATCGVTGTAMALT